MNWVIPGTTLTAKTQDAVHIEQQFRAMFLAGGMVLSQVSAITGLEPYTVQNWVKRGFLTSPKQKRYDMSQLCRIININMLKAALPMEQICGLLTYINGCLDDSSDDLIDDAVLYFLFVRLAANYSMMNNSQGREAYLEEVLADYREPMPGAKERVRKVLRVMLTAWAAAMLRQKAGQMAATLNENEQKTEKE